MNPQKETTKLTKRQLKIMAVLGGLCLVLIIGITAYMTLMPPKPDDQVVTPPPISQDPKGLYDVVSIAPSSTQDGLIPIDATFLVETATDTPVDYIKETFASALPTPLEVSQKDSRHFVLKPKAPLNKGTIVNFKHLNADKVAGWAYQVVSEMEVKSVYPDYASNTVPLNSTIELEFNRPIDKSIEDFLAIEPAVPFTVTLEGDKVILHPSQALEEAVRYVVTLKSAYRNHLGDGLAADFTLAFTTTSGTIGRTSELEMGLYTVGDPIGLLVSTYGEDAGVDLKLYQAPSFEDYAQRLNQYRTDLEHYQMAYKKVDTRGLKLLLDQEQNSITMAAKQIIAMPDLPLGNYIAFIDDGSKMRLDFFQVCDKALYFEAGGSKDDYHTLVWALDTTTGQAVENAELSIYGNPQKKATTTDKNGVAVIDALASENLLQLTPKNGQPILLPTNKSNEYSYEDYEIMPSRAKDAKQSFIYTDRSTYLPGETVHYFGFLRFQDRRKVENVTIKFKGGAVEEAVGEAVGATTESSTLSKDVPVTPYGTFSGSFDLSKSAFGNSLQVMVGEIPIAETYIEISEYVKPEIIITAKSDREPAVMTLGESLTATGNVAYFDETIAKLYPLKFSAITSGTYQQKDLFSKSTDKAGAFREKITPAFDYTSSAPVTYTVIVENDEAEARQTSATFDTLVYPSQVVLDAKIESKDGLQLDLSASTHALKVPDPNLQDPQDIKSYTGAPLSLPIQILLTESYYNPILKGTRYNPILKIEEPLYDYQFIENTLLNENAQTLDGTFNMNYQGIKGHSYQLKITLEDKPGHSISATSSYNSNYRTNETGYDENGDPMDPRYALPPTFEPEVRVKLDQTFSIPMNMNPRLLALSDPQKAKTLFITYKNTFDQYTLVQGTAPAYTNTFKDTDIPNIVLAGVYFDGKRFQLDNTPATTIIALDQTEKHLDIAIETDLKKYKPGDGVTATIKASLKGKPLAVSGVLNIVDEAYYAIFQDTSNAYLEFNRLRYETRIYETYYTGQIKEFYGAEMGEGGSDGVIVRDQFKDTADFIPFTTDDEGKAVLKFDLPDNIAKWRLTAHATSKNFDIGTQRENLIATLPFYCRILGESKYITTDQPSLTLRSGGELISATNLETSSAKVTYTLDLVDPTGKTHTLTSSAHPSKPAHMALPPLTKGPSKYTLRATYQGASDTIVGTFEVVDSKLDIPGKKSTLEGISGDTLLNYTLRSPQKNTSLNIWHHEAQKQESELRGFLGLNRDRFEYALAGDIAAAKLFLQEPYEDSLEAFLEYGYIKPLVSASTDLAITAEALAIAPHLRTGIYTYDLNSTIASKERSMQDKLYAYWILSSLGQPVLYDLNKIDPRALSVTDRIILACCYVQLGSYDRAETLADQTLEGLTNHFILLQAGTQAAIGSPLAQATYDKVLPNLPKDHIEQVVQLRFLLSQTKRLDPLTLRYTLGGISKEMTLTTSEPYTIQIPANTAFAFESATAPISMVEHYRGDLTTLPLDAPSLAKAQAQNLTINRSLENSQGKVLDESSTLAPGDEVRVTLTLTGPKDKWCEAIETIPSGFLLVKPYYAQNMSQLRFTKISNQLSQTFEYTLKAKQQGIYTLEPSIATIDCELFNSSKPTTLEVK